MLDPSNRRAPLSLLLGEQVTKTRNNNEFPKSGDFFLTPFAYLIKTPQCLDRPLGTKTIAPQAQCLFTCIQLAVKSVCHVDPSHSPVDSTSELRP